ncbi:hypothetical protein DLM76_18580 [Leptospira yasudae]|uniref:FAD/NAD(P)-binding protein n=1 Tax=Leptospira yasudae TaxID=2202201 RepID=UPI000E59C4FB|nr:FAD/NAD(P)-binding protein [Leptospira yasudae]RHX91169.1 hypothetical protein DLM76_18580 [Leptospira yasudae]
MSKISVAIVGGGLSGSLLTIQFLQNARDPIQVFLIEKSRKRLGRGIAYSPNSIYQKLNVPASRMSLYGDKPKHFWDWWQEHKNNYFYLEEHLELDSFFPRFIFGDYVEYELNRSIRNKPEFVDYNFINDNAFDVEKENGKWNVFLDSGSQVHVDIVILATGNIPPGDPSFLSAEVLNSKKYANNPWDDNLYENIRGTEAIGILGSGLSMVDVLMSLNRKGFEGQIISLSRSGKLPKVHDRIGNKNPTEYTNFHGDLRKDVSEFRHWLKENEGISYANILDAFRPLTQRVWMSWSTEDQLRFLRHIRPYWESFRHRIPEDSMQIIDEWINAGKLKFVRARIKSVKIVDESIGIIYNEIHSSNHYIQVDHLINCTGPETKIKKSNSLLYSNLLEKGIIKNAKNDLGFLTSEGGVVIDSKDKPAENLFALGPLRKNEFWESTALKEIRDQSSDLSKRILELAYLENKGRKTKFDIFCTDLLATIPNVKNLSTVLSIFKKYSKEEIIHTIANSIGWIRPEVGYSRLRLMTQPYEILMMVWAPQGETSLHKHVNFGGALVVLQGSLVEMKYTVRSGRIALADEKLLKEEECELENVDGIHMVKNPSLNSYAVSLHIYHPTMDSLTSMEIYDLENNIVGVLNERAKTASWKEPGSSFKSITSLTVS